MRNQLQIRMVRTTLINMSDGSRKRYKDVINKVNTLMGKTILYCEDTIGQGEDFLTSDLMLVVLFVMEMAPAFDRLMNMEMLKVSNVSVLLPSSPWGAANRALILNAFLMSSGG